MERREIGQKLSFRLRELGNPPLLQTFRATKKQAYVESTCSELSQACQSASTRTMLQYTRCPFKNCCFAKQGQPGSIPSSQHVAKVETRMPVWVRTPCRSDQFSAVWACLGLGRICSSTISLHAVLTLQRIAANTQLYIALIPISSPSGTCTQPSGAVDSSTCRASLKQLTQLENSQKNNRSECAPPVSPDECIIPPCKCRPPGQT